MTRRPATAAGPARAPAAARRDAIREILARGPVPSQDELQRHLRARGIRAAQATLSRDLAALGVRRGSGPAGPRYVIEGDAGGLPIEPVRRLAESVETNGLMVVVRTKASAASTVARAIDDARLPEVLGTLAGDDTIFVVPGSARGAASLVKGLRRLLGV
jgi:transcriptional regulator of arginine metabolism